MHSPFRVSEGMGHSAGPCGYRGHGAGTEVPGASWKLEAVLSCPGWGGGTCGCLPRAPELGAQGRRRHTAAQLKPSAVRGEQGRERLAYLLRLTFPPTRSLSFTGEESAAPRAAMSEVSLPWRGRVEAGPGLSAPRSLLPLPPHPACQLSLLIHPPFHLLATAPPGAGLVPPQRRQQLLSTHLGGVPQAAQLYFCQALSEYQSPWDPGVGAGDSPRAQVPMGAEEEAGRGRQ